MAQVPIEDLMEHVDSKYRLVMVAAKRAKQLNRGAVPLVQVRSVKPIYQALEEVATGKLTYEIENTVSELAAEADAKPTWYRSLSAEPEEAVAEAEEQIEEEEAAVEAPITNGAAEGLLMNEFEEEGAGGAGRPRGDRARRDGGVGPSPQVTRDSHPLGRGPLQQRKDDPAGEADSGARGARAASRHDQAPLPRPRHGGRAG